MSLTYERLVELADIAANAGRDVYLTRQQISEAKHVLAEHSANQQSLQPSGLWPPSGPLVVMCDTVEESDPWLLGWVT